MADRVNYTTYEDFPYEDLLTYAGLDCVVTSSLLRKLWPTITAEPQVAVFDGAKRSVVRAPSILQVTEDYEMKFHEFIIDMELNGIKFDVEENARVKEQMETELSELRAEIFSCIGMEIDLDSGKEVSELLYNKLNLTAERFTKTGQPSIDAEAMMDLMKRYPEHKWLQDMGRYGDIVSTYRTFVQNYVKDHVKSDGRVHPQYNQILTSSFRVGSAEPNLTQLPNAKHGYNLRKQFCVPEGKVFLTADFSSAEVKVLGAISQDPGILKAIADGMDFHSFAATKINNLDYNKFVKVLEDKKHPNFKKYKSLRQAAKAVGFGILKLLRLKAGMLLENDVNSVEPLPVRLKAILSQAL